MKMAAIAPVMLLVLGGGVFGAAKAGIVNVPGVSPPKKPPASAEKPKASKPPSTKPVERAKQSPPTSPTRAKEEAPMVPEEKKVAQIWNEIPAETLASMARQYKDPELARVLVHMDTEKAAQVLGTLEPKRAAEVSRLVGRESVR